MLDSFLKIMNYKSELCNGLNTVFKSAFLPCFAFGAHAHTRTHTQSPSHAHTLAVLLYFVRINEKSSRALRVISVLGVK